MLRVAFKFGIMATQVLNPKIATMAAFMKSSGNSMVLEISDFETDNLHYIMVHNITPDGIVEYSDPDRKPDMKIDLATLEAHAKFAILFKAKKMTAESASEIGDMIDSARAEVGPSETVVAKSTDDK